MKIEIRTYCKICGTKITEKGFRTFCSEKCRKKSTADRQRKKRRTDKFREEYNEYQRDRWQKRMREKNAIQCLICGKWFVQVGSHIVQRHGLTAREYREYFELDVKRGTIPLWYRKLKGEIALENGTYKNLENGKKFWFKKGDTKAGRYKRSNVTLERLKDLHKKRKIDKGGDKL